MATFHRISWCNTLLQKRTDTENIANNAQSVLYIPPKVQICTAKMSAAGVFLVLKVVRAPSAWPPYDVCHDFLPENFGREQIQRQYFFENDLKRRQFHCWEYFLLLSFFGAKSTKGSSVVVFAKTQRQSQCSKYQRRIP
ncbi:hypothetical protein Y032_0924g3058 [Ancylostoma ceylanicum]|uniref:Uncharacterized protein n=1 Tax=Ancylostoma ceylanicum TaxID=53326 RepID=A0A016W8M0_9BILA|nr:hypothetical protein Y032_0924g3058 [Ancylostoma ceylanicum]